mmetsp:Transcript_86531/g.242307  ORF Transcript_86531/g.242307 Transcript_86531/m.242307 type:complete len:225 (-) Transcript_86531:104-778(-)
MPQPPPLWQIAGVITASTRMRRTTASTAMAGAKPCLGLTGVVLVLRAGTCQAHAALTRRRCTISRWARAAPKACEVEAIGGGVARAGRGKNPATAATSLAAAGNVPPAPLQMAAAQRLRTSKCDGLGASSASGRITRSHTTMCRSSVPLVLAVVAEAAARKATRPRARPPRRRRKHNHRTMRWSALASKLQVPEEMCGRLVSVGGHFHVRAWPRIAAWGAANYT